MKPFNEEDLIAYHMHELAPRRARALERALQTDPALAADFESYATLLEGFKSETTSPVDDELLERAWLAVRPSLTIHQVPAGMRFRWQLPALAGGGLAFAGTLAFVAMHHHKPAPMPSTAALRQPEDVPQDARPAPGALRADASPQGEFESLKRPEPVRVPSPDGAHHGVHDVMRPRISYLSLARTPALLPQFIPLASLPAPALPPPGSIDGLISLYAPSQDSSSGESSRSKRERFARHPEHATDLTFAMGGTLIGTRQGSSSGGMQNYEGATHAVSAVVAFHQQLRRAVGYRVTFSYTRPEFQFTTRNATSSYGTVGLNSRIFEVAGTYVLRGPHTGRLGTSAEAGAGFMSFVPTTAALDTHSNLRAAAVIGVAAEVALTKHLALHAGYRGQLFRGPDFKSDGPVGPFVTSTLFSHEPTVGITYRFIHK